MFKIDARLLSESTPLVTLKLCHVLLRNDRRFPWLILIPQHPDVAELFDLSDTDQSQLMSEITLCSKALQHVSSCDKINVGALGNIVRQLHIHIVARHTTDECWPGPVWGQGHREPYDDQGLETLAFRMRGLLSTQRPSL